MRFAEAAWLVTRKDLLIEFRSREIVYTTLFFAVSCVLVFAFGFVREGARSRTRPPAFCGWRSPSPERWRSAARSSASGRTRRCAAC